MRKNKMQLSRKTALAIGFVQGIGLAIAKAFARESAKGLGSCICLFSTSWDRNYSHAQTVMLPNHM
jgi:hypothetical protein